MSSDVSFVLTSCGRFDLLRETLQSFFAVNDYPIEKFIITEDSGDARVHDALADLPAQFEVIVNRPQLGQMASVDLAYGRVTTPYVFHCEDDWLFTRGGFIQQSKILLENLPDVVMVNLRAQEDMPPGSFDHPLEQAGGVSYRKLRDPARPERFGFSFNPGLRRMSDYREIGAYAPFVKENTISKHYLDQGKGMVTLENGGVSHLGHRRTVRDPFQPWRPVSRVEKLFNSVRKRVRKIF